MSGGSGNPFAAEERRAVRLAGKRASQIAGARGLGGGIAGGIQAGAQASTQALFAQRRAEAEERAAGRRAGAIGSLFGLGGTIVGALTGGPAGAALGGAIGGQAGGLFGGGGAGGSSQNAAALLNAALTSQAQAAEAGPTQQPAAFSGAQASEIEATAAGGPQAQTFGAPAGGFIGPPQDPAQFQARLDRGVIPSQAPGAAAAPGPATSGLDTPLPESMTASGPEQEALRMADAARVEATRAKISSEALKAISTPELKKQAQADFSRIFQVDFTPQETVASLSLLSKLAEKGFLV